MPSAQAAFGPQLSQPPARGGLWSCEFCPKQPLSYSSTTNFCSFYIEDAPKGIVAAKNAGMKAIAVPTKDTQFGDFDEADIVLPNLDEVTVELVNMI